MNKRETKKREILLAGLNVMREHGYNGTSVKDIVDAAGVPKGSFYNYFESKEDFVLEAIEFVAGESCEMTSSMLQDTTKPVPERILHFFTSGTERACLEQFRGGCFLGTMCQELSDTSDSVRAKLRSVMRRHIALIADVLEEGRREETVTSNLPSQTIAEFLFNAWEGALMAMKTAKSREPLDAFVQILPRVLL